MLKISYESCLSLSLAISSQFTLEVSAEVQKRKKAKKPSIGGSRSFKVTDVNKTKIPVTSACYDKHLYLSATVFTLGEPIPLFHAFVRGEPPHPGAQNFVTKNQNLGTAHGKDFVILVCTVLIGLQSVTDGRTGRQTDGQTPRP